MPSGSVTPQYSRVKTRHLVIARRRYPVKDSIDTRVDRVNFLVHAIDYMQDPQRGVVCNAFGIITREFTGTHGGNGVIRSVVEPIRSWIELVVFLAAGILGEKEVLVGRIVGNPSRFTGKIGGPSAYRVSCRSDRFQKDYPR